MKLLEKFLKKEKIELLIWDFDEVIYTLDWHYQETPKEFLEKLYYKICEIDPIIIQDKDEFISRLFPYPEINEVGKKYGREIQLQVKQYYLEKEMMAIERAIPNDEVIDYIRTDSKFHHAVWSNNYSDTIEYLLKKADIVHRIKFISSIDKVILSKPYTEGFDLIRENFPDITKDKICMIGDSLRSDKVGAENAGIKFFYFLSK